MRMGTPVWLGAVLGLGLWVSCGGGGSRPNAVAPPVPVPREGQVLPAFQTVKTAGLGAGAPLPLVPLEHRWEDLATFMRVAASIQYFHPSDGVADTNWDEFLQYGSYTVASRPASQSLGACLGELFAPMAPQVRFGGGASDEPQGALLAAWIRKGYKDREASATSTYMAERRLMARDKMATAEEGPRVTQARLTVNGLPVAIPLVQAWDGQRTLPPSQGFRMPASWSLSNLPDDPYLGLAVAGKAWGVLRTFFPYFEAVGLDWEQELLPLLRACAGPTNRAAALDRALRLALTRLQDNHAVMPSLVPQEAAAYLPVVMDWIEGRVVILHSRTTDIQRGWEVLRVNGTPITELVEAVRPTCLKNDRHARTSILSGYAGLSRQKRDSVVTLELRDGAGQLKTFPLIANQDAEVYGEAFRFRDFYNLPLTQWLEPGLLYANLSDAVDDSAIRQVNAELSRAKGVVFDLRRYPKAFSMVELFARFSTQTVNSLPMRHLWPSGPDEAPRYLVSPQSTPGIGDLRIPALVICSRSSQSYNEHVLGYAQSAGLKIMGEPTSGANGNITTMTFSQLPGFSITFTGMELRQHDLSRFHGVGILPDLLRPRTVESIRKGNDEVLEAAQAWVRERMPR